MIICLGTTPALTRAMTFERLVTDDVNRAVDVRVSAAGKSVNVARVLKTLGEEPIATGFVGGNTGRAIQDELTAIGVAHDFVLLAGPTRVCVTVIDRAMETATELVEETPAVAPEHWAALGQKLLALIPKSPVLVLSGSLAPGAPDGFNGECAHVAAGAGVQVVVDARDKPLLDTLAHRPTWVKPNRSELTSTVAEAITSDESLKRAMLRLIESGASNVAVTLGGEGAAATDGVRFIKAASPKVKVVSAIGSGDAFAAGLATATARGLGLDDSLRLAIACGAANATTAQAGHLDAGMVNLLISSIEIARF